MEKGGLNLYGFVLNNPINLWDYLGMQWVMYTGQWDERITWQPEPGEYIWLPDEEPFDFNRIRGGGRFQMPELVLWATPPGTSGPVPIRPPSPANPIGIKPWSENQYKDGSGAESVVAAVSGLLEHLRTLTMPDGSETKISQIIKAIEHSQFSVDIYAAEHPNMDRQRTQGRNPGTSTEPNQTGSIIYFAPGIRYLSARGGGVNGEDIYAEPLTTLAHELAHAYRHITIGDDGLFTFEEEFEAVRVDNQLRSILGLPLQIKAGGQVVPDYNKYVPKPPE